jgi:hypothetical protein
MSVAESFLAIQRVCDYVTGVAERALYNVRYRSESVTLTSTSGLHWITNTSIFDQWLPRYDGRILFVDWEGTEYGRNFPDGHVVAIADTLLQRSPQSMNCHLTNLDLRDYSRLFVETRHCQDHLCEHHNHVEGKPHYVPVDVQRPMTPKEIMIAFACVQLGRNTSQPNLAVRISQMHSSHRRLLETISSEESVREGSRVDCGPLLRHHGDAEICDLVVHSLQGLPFNTLALFSIRHLADSASHRDQVESMMGTCCELLKDTSTKLQAVMHIYGSRSSVMSPHTISRKTEYLGKIPMSMIPITQSTKLICFLECLASLKVRDVLTRQNQILPPAPGTCNWLDDHPSFDAWQKVGGTLWIRGKPGSGKSTLAKDILVRLRFRDRLTMVGAWFYSVKLDFAQRSHQSLLLALLGNFLEQNETLFQELVHIYRKARTPPYDSWKWSRDLLEEFLRAISQTSRDSTIMAVIDALDESENDNEIDKSREHLATFLLDLAEHPGSCMRFIILSRPYESLQTIFRDCQQIVLEQENGKDLEEVIDRDLRWLRHTINKSSDFEAQDNESESLGRRKRRKRSGGAASAACVIQPDPALAVSIDVQFQAMRDYLIHNAQGVFLWVTLVLKELHQTSKDAFLRIMDLDRALRSLPSELEDLYAAIATRLQKRGLKRTRRILDWIIGTSQSRALTLSMLFEAMSVDEGITVKASTTPLINPFLAHKSIVRHQSWGAFAFDVYDQCGGLVDVVPPDEGRKRFQEYHEEEINEKWVAVLLHRTSLDFIASTRCPEALRTDMSHARSVVEHGLVTYMQVYLPMTTRQGTTFHPRLNIQGEVESTMRSFSSPCEPLPCAKDTCDSALDFSRLLEDASRCPMSSDLATVGKEAVRHRHRRSGPEDPVLQFDSSHDDVDGHFHQGPQSVFPFHHAIMDFSGNVHGIDMREPCLYQGIGAHFAEEATEGFDGQLCDIVSDTRGVLSPTANIYVNQLFSAPDEPLLQYFEERRLLSFGLEMIPELLDNVHHRDKLYPYKILASTAPAATVPAWFRWLQDIPSNILLAACEKNYANALKSIKTLLDLSPSLRKKSLIATSGALMLFYSRHEPTTEALHMIEVYFNELKRECGYREDFRFIVYEIVLACTSHRKGLDPLLYKDLDSYLIRRMFRTDLDDERLSQTREVGGMIYSRTNDDSVATWLLRGMYANKFASSSSHYRERCEFDKSERLFGTDSAKSTCVDLLQSFPGVEKGLSSYTFHPCWPWLELFPEV